MKLNAKPACLMLTVFFLTSFSNVYALTKNLQYPHLLINAHSDQLPHHYTIKQAFLAALTTNPDAAESRANNAVAWEAYKQVRGGFFPQLNINYQVGRSKNVTASNGISSPYVINTAQQKLLTLTQLLFDGGALSNKVDSAKLQFASAYQTTVEQINELALKTVSVYLEVLRTDELKKLAEQNLALHRDTLSQEHERYKQGIGDSADVSLSEARLERAQLAFDKANQDVANARAAYLQIIGQYPPSFLTVPENLGGRIPQTLSEFKSMQEGNNPAIASAKESVNAAQHDVASTKAALYFPTVSAQLSADKNNNFAGFRGKTVNMQGLLVINYNLLTGGSDTAAMKKAMQQKIASQEHLDSIRRQVALSMEKTWNELHMSKLNTRTLEKGIQSNQNIVRDYKDGLKLGKRTLLVLLDAGNDLYTAKTLAIDNKYRILIDTYTLLAYAGTLPQHMVDNPAKYYE